MRVFPTDYCGLNKARPHIFSKIFKSLFGALPTSSILSAGDAGKIVAAFGDLVAELNDPKRYTLEDHQNKRPFAFPLSRLPHSKHEIQTALAVVIADLVLDEASNPSRRQRELLYAAKGASGDLAYFTDGHVALGQYAAIQQESQMLYSLWQESCEEIWGKVSQTTPNRGRSFEGLGTYWRKVDVKIRGFLEEPALKAIHET